MEDKNVNMSEVVAEVKSATEDELKKVIEQHFKEVRNNGMKAGVTYMAAAIHSIIKKHIQKPTGAKASLRDYQRCMDDIIKLISVQLTQQNDLKPVEEEVNDGTAE